MMPVVPLTPNRRQLREFSSATMLLCTLVAALAVGVTASSPVSVRPAWPSRLETSAWTVLAAGERSDDRRLGSLRTLDTHCPFTPPVTLTDWQHRAAVLRRQLHVALGLWPVPTR
jgi:hypothetical protein